MRLAAVLVVLGAVAGFALAGLLIKGLGVEAYCVKCREKRQMQDAQVIKMKNGRLATPGICPECGTQMFRMGASSLLVPPA